MQMTRNQLEDIGEIWYQRTHRLREVWQDETQPETRREKAFILWGVMSERVTKLVLMIHELNAPKIPHNFPSGGVMLRS